MERKILAAANAEKQKYFLEPEFRELPESIQEEVRVICVLLAQKLNCTFLMGFDEAGELYFERCAARTILILTRLAQGWKSARCGGRKRSSCARWNFGMPYILWRRGRR